MTDDGPVAWCCASHDTCSAHGWTVTETQATVAAIAHWRVWHRG